MKHSDTKPSVVLYKWTCVRRNMCVTERLQSAKLMSWCLYTILCFLLRFLVIDRAAIKATATVLLWQAVEEKCSKTSALACILPELW